MINRERALIRLNRAGLRSGFTLVELLLVLIIGGILMSYAVPSFTRITSAQNAQNARDRLVWMANRARSTALTQGRVELLEISPARNAAWIVRRGGTTAADTTEIVNFTGEYTATVTTSTNNTITVCYSARGYAFVCTGNSPTANVDATITHIDKTATARIKPLGQIERI
jgi:prepilin-type N-terminal cleavage/methylation domain-containing protein